MEPEKKLKLKKYVAIFKLLVLVSIIFGLSITIYLFSPEFISIFKDLEKTKTYLANYKTASIFVYLLLQIIQIVISVLPGQVLQFAAGYIYGFIFGTIWSLLGIALGTILTFYLSKFLGKDAMHIIFGEERITKFINILNTKKAYTIIFVIFLIPGIPKDLFSYAAGVSEIKLKPFLILSLVGRLPALLATIAMSRLLYNESYAEFVIFSIVIVILFLLGIWKRKHLTEYIDMAYNKIKGK